MKISLENCYYNLKSIKKEELLKKCIDEDKANRISNIFAIQNTVKYWKFLHKEGNEIMKIYQDKNGKRLKINDRIKNEEGEIGNLRNIDGKSFIKFTNHKILVSEANFEHIEKI